MTRAKEQAFDLLRDIPDDKIAPVIEILRGLRVLCMQDDVSASPEITPESVMGIANKYANPALIPLEKEAWGEAVKEKHVIR